MTDYYREELLSGIADFAREAGWELNANMRFHGGFPPETLHFDGILATITGVLGEKVLNWLVDRPGSTVVRMFNTCFSLPYPAVEPDYAAAGSVGARHLLELGYAHCAFYSIFSGPDTHETQVGFEATLKAGGRQALRIDMAEAYPDRPMLTVPLEERCRCLARELQRLPKPLAVMSDDDRRSLEVLEACKLIGLRVPEDVAILGCDNNWFEQLLSPVPLSSVDMDFRTVGRQAAALLNRLMEGEVPPTKVIKVPPLGVVARRSTATFVTESPTITAAVMHLREHFDKRLRLADLARQAGMSEQAFRLEFKRLVGRTVREELLHAKLNRAKCLLRDTDQKLETVAVESGFHSDRHLCGVFAEVYGLTPHTWRQQARNRV